jgi:sugar (pentulose or hexulose) kinase
MRGVSLKFLVMDEYADMKPDVWEQILRPALADQKGSAMFIGTPMGRNHFYELYKFAELGDDETYRGWHFTSYDNPATMKLTGAGISPATTTQSWTHLKSTWQKNQCRVMPLDKSLWPRLKPEAQKCLKKIGYSLEKNQKKEITT